MSNNQHPLLSIIIPTFNSEGTIIQTLDSIIKQSYINYEVLIIDGASTDHTLTLITPYIDKYSFKLISEKDKGVYDAMNKGIKIANGDFLYFLGSDDVLYSENTLNNFFKNNLENIDILYGNVLFKNSNKIYSGESSLQKLKYDQISICHQAIFYSKRTFNIIGLYNLDYFIHADYEYNLRCFKSDKLTIKFQDDIVAIFNEAGLSGLNSNADNFHTHLTENNILENNSIIDLYNQNKLLKKEIASIKKSKGFKIGNAIIKPFKIFKKIL